MASPQVAHVLIFALLIGVWFVLVPWGDSFAMVPGGLHSFVYYILYFYLGVVAKRNDWLTEVMKLPTKGGGPSTFFLWSFSAFLGLVMVVFFCTTAKVFPGNTDEDIAQAGQYMPYANFFMGIFAVVICLAEFQIFAEYFNNGSKVSKIFCEAAYTAYLIHFFFINCGIELYFRLAKAVSPLPSESFFTVSSNNCLVHGLSTDNEVYSWFGFLFVATFANLCTWPVAHLLRKLPLLNKIL